VKAEKFDSVPSPREERSRGTAPLRARFGSTWRGVLDVIATIAMAVVAGVMLWRTFETPGGEAPRQPVPIPTQPLSLEGLPLLGSREARVGLLVFSDFECPFCARFQTETMPNIVAQYVDKGLAKIGFRHLPLPIHSRAERAAAAAECASQQGRFWEMHDALFSNPLKLEESDLFHRAVSLQLDGERFEQCMSRPPLDRIKQDAAIAQAIGLTGTPAFVVGTIRNDSLQATGVLIGALPAKEFETVLTQALNAS
jgi:protein-disulfide isomerase